MSACDDCGTKLSDGICPNCCEELFIYEEQILRHDMDIQPSEEFMRKVDEQRKEAPHED